MGLGYTVSYTGTLTTSGDNADLFELLPADDHPIRLVGLLLSQISEVGDAAEEGLQISIIRLPATVTSSNGSAATPKPTGGHAVAAGFSAKVNGATIATTSGTADIVEESGWNIRVSPVERWWIEDKFSHWARQGEALVIRSQTTALDNITIAITAYIEES